MAVKAMKKEFNWMIVFWISIIITFLWLIAKAVGLINTPRVLEAIPYVGGLTALLVLGKEAGRYIQKLETAISDIREIRIELSEFREEISEINVKISSIDKRLAVVESKI